MKAGGMIVGMVIGMAIVWSVIKLWYVPELAAGQPAAEAINEAGIKSDLLAIAQAEKIYLSSHGSYASLDALQRQSSIAVTSLRWSGYVYTAEVDDGRHFKITARTTDVSKCFWPVFSVDEGMQVTAFAGGILNQSGLAVDARGR